jgi:hypothetical protein
VPWWRHDAQGWFIATSGTKGRTLTAAPMNLPAVTPFLGFLRLALGKGIQEHETDISTKQNQAGQNSRIS